MRVLADGTKVVWEPLKGSQTLSLTCPANIIVFHGTRGPGKRLADTTPVLTNSGWKNAGDITYDDKLVAMDGTYTNLIGIFPCKNRILYNVEFYDGAIIEADEDHRWLTLNSKTGYCEGWKVRTTKKLMSMAVPCAVPYLEGAIPGNQWNGPDPYMLGYILANGTMGSKNVTIYSIDEEILEYAKNKHNWLRYQYEGQTALRAVSRAQDDHIWREVLCHEKGPNKYIPEGLMTADPETRLALLQGLMDGDGNYEKGAQTRYMTSSKQLADQVVYLVKSLGGWAGIHERTNAPEHDTFGTNTLMYCVNISHHNKFNPFRLKRKAEQVKEQKKFLTRGIKSITFSRYGDGVCFAVDHPSHCFVIDDFVVTHNTDAQLMRFRRNVGQGYGRYWRGIIFDREYKNLDDLVSKSMRWFPEFKDGARFMSSKADYRWVWPTGEELLFRAIKKDTDYWGYHGQEFPFIGWNELTKYPNDNLFESMMSCNRSSFLPMEHPQYYGDDPTPHYLDELPLEIFITTNPHGAGHNWVKKRFITPGKPGQIVRRVVNVFNPRTQQREDIAKTQTHIFGSYRENRYLSPQYVAELESITDPNKRRAWLFGDWDIVAGGMFDDVWDQNIHVIEPFDIPSNWRIDRSYDHGESRPFSVGWWAESDGSDVKLSDGRWMSTVKGDLFRIDEWYGWTGKPNQGLRLLSIDIAAGIVEREVQAGIYNRVVPGPADNSIWDVENGNSIAADMAKPVKINGKRYKGVQWHRSDKAKGSRTAGWKQLRQYLKDALPILRKDENGKEIILPREKPGMFIFNTCKMFAELFPVAPRDETNPDDIDTDSEDHICDEARYKALSTETGARGGRTQGM